VCISLFLHQGRSLGLCVQIDFSDMIVLAEEFQFVNVILDVARWQKSEDVNR